MIEAKKWSSTSNLEYPQKCKYISVIHTARGKEVLIITNGLVRDFFPKGTDFTKVSKQEVSKIQHWINERPRETLNDKTLIEAIKELLSNINIALAS
jgi:hypothetical protein